MKDFSKGYFTTMRVIDLVLGIIFCITIAGLIFGIPLIIASNKFDKARNMAVEELIQARGNLLGWGIFSAIVLAPSIIGLIIVLVLVCMVNNYIKNLEVGKVEEANKSFGETIKDGAQSFGVTLKEGTKKTISGAKEIFGIKSKNEKLKDQLAELQQLKDDGIITEEEYNIKRSELITKL